MEVSPLITSPIAIARARQYLTRAEAAEILGMPVGRLKVLEMKTKTIPQPTIDAIITMLNTPRDYQQVTIFDYIASMQESDTAEDEHNG